MADRLHQVSSSLAQPLQTGQVIFLPRPVRPGGRAHLPRPAPPAYRDRTCPAGPEDCAMSTGFTRKSLITTGGPGRAPNRAMLRAVGFTDDDFSRPIVGVASLFSDITPCNSHLDRLALKGREGVRAAGGVPQTFGAPTVSDGISMGHPGMRYSLVSREVI